MMKEIVDFVVGFGETSIQYFWLPFITWTLTSLVALIIFRLTPNSHPLFHYHTRLALLLSLPFVFLFSHFISFSFFSDVQLTAVNFILAEESILAGTQQEDVIMQSMHWLGLILGIITLIALLLAVWGLLKLAVHYYIQEKYRRKLSSLSDSYYTGILDSTRNIVQFNSRVDLYKSSLAQVPLTFGWLKPVIILPDRPYDDQSLKTVLLHEMIHIKRGDYLLNWFQELVRAIFFLNPMIWYISREINDYREISCDAEVLAYDTTSAKSYATLLLNTAGNTTPCNPLFAPMAQPKSKLTKRILAMSKYKSLKTEYNKIRTSSLLLSVALGILVVFISSCDFSSLNENEPLQQSDVSQENEEAEKQVFAVVETMPKPSGGIEALYNNLIYPQEAREEGIEGRVSVQFTVDEEGNPSDAEVLRGIGGGADEAAVDALLDTQWTPGEQRGQAVPVRFVYTVQFRLSSDHANINASSDNT